MALIKCPECEKEVSDKAAACPHCGCPVEKKIETPKIEEIFHEENWKEENDDIINKRVNKFPLIIIIFIIIIIGLFIVIGTIYLVSSKQSSIAKISKEMQSYGNNVIEIVDDYFDNDIDYITAYKKIESIKNSAFPDSKYIDDESVKTEIENILSALNRSSDYSLRSSKDNLKRLLE